MRRGVVLALLFGVVFTVALAARLPLRWALPFLPRSLHCAQPEGTLWSGACRGLTLTPPGLAFTEVDWDWRPARLLRFRLALDVRVKRGDAVASGLVQLSPERIEMLDLEGNGPLEPGLPAPLAGWAGQVLFKGLRVRFVDGRLDTIDGHLEAHGLRSPQGAAWGSYRLDIPRATAPGLVAPGQLASIDGPLKLKGTLQVKPAERSWQLDVRLAVQPGAGPELGNALGALGPPDADGLRPLSVAGAY